MGLIHSVSVYRALLDQACPRAGDPAVNKAGEFLFGVLDCPWGTEIQARDRIDYKTPSDDVEFYEEKETRWGVAGA